MRTGVCRTCNEENIVNQYKLMSKLRAYPGKQLLDLLFEVTGIDAKMDQIEMMPQQLCELCAAKLKHAYDFVMQARQTNNYFLAMTECLQEVPILCPEEEEEEEEEAEENIVLSKIVEDEEVAETANVNDPLVECKGSKQSGIYLRNITEDRLFKCTQCSKSFHWPQNLKQHMRKHSNEEDWYSCPHCSRKYYRKDSLRSHLKTHGHSQKRNLTWNTEKRRNMKAESVDLNLCKPNGCKLIVCMICQQKFLKINELRYHLNNHPAVDNEQYMSLAENLCFDNDEMSKDQFMEIIRNDMESGAKHSLFCSITNQAGYELSLDSSDTDSESDDIPTNAGDKKDAIIKKIKYKCELCEANYQRKYQLFQHQQQQHKWLDAPYVCSRCDGRFVCKQLFDHHQKSQCKNPQKRYICCKCPLRFYWKHNLKSHLKEHNNPSTTQSEFFECDECKRSFLDQKGLKVHMKTVHGEESNFLLCQWCERKFYRRDCLVKHMLRHGIKEVDVPQAENLMAAIASANGQKSILCKICNRNFNSIKELRMHLRDNHNGDNSAINYSITNSAGYELYIEDSDTDDGDDEDDDNDVCDGSLKYTCDLCKKQQRRKYEMIQHQRFNHRFDKYPNQCEICIFKCVSKDILDYHKRTQCFNTDKCYQCEICCYKFMWKENLELHQKLQHSVLKTDNLNVEEKVITKPTSPKFVCPHCGKSYNVKGCLNNHIKDVHIDGNRKMKESLKKYMCTLCGLQMSVKSKLAIHTRVHTGEKPYKCDYCDKTFARRYQADTHRRVHTGDKPFNCTECDKSFARTDRLRKHLEMHMKKPGKGKKKIVKIKKENLNDE